jgi:hypothetical protein
VHDDLDTLVHRIATVEQDDLYLLHPRRLDAMPSRRAG